MNIIVKPGGIVIIILIVGGLLYMIRSSVQKHKVKNSIEGAAASAVPITASPFATPRGVSTPSAEIIRPDASGNLVLLATAATLHGEHIEIEKRADKPNIGYWNSPDAWVSWQVKFPKAGKYKIIGNIAAESTGSQFVVAVGNQQIIGQSVATGGWDKFQTETIGRITATRSGTVEVTIRPHTVATWQHPINLQKVTFLPIP